jgi:hypothetical protein
MLPIESRARRLGVPPGPKRRAALRGLIFPLLVYVIASPAQASAQGPGSESGSVSPTHESSDRPTTPPKPPPWTFLSSAGISRDGALVATGHTLDRGRNVKYGRGPASGSAGTGLPGLLCVWDVRTGALRRAFDAHRLLIYRTRFLPDGFLLTGGSDGPFSTDGQAWRVWDVESGRRIHDLRMEFGIFREDVTRDGLLLVDQGPRAGTINVLDLRAGKFLRTIDGHAEASLGAVFAPDGSRLLFFGLEKGTRKSVPYRIDIRDGGTVKKFPADIFLATYSLDGRRVAGVRQVPIPGIREGKQEIVVVNAESGKPFTAFGKWQASPRLLNMTFLPDGRLLCADTHVLTVWDADDGRQARSIPIDQATDEVSFSGDFRFAVATDYGVRRSSDPMPADLSAVRVYDINNGQIVRTWRGPWPPH